VVASAWEAGPNVLANDGKCDPAGRFRAGTLTERPTVEGASALYRLDPDLRVTKVLGGVTVSNGLGWSDDAPIMARSPLATGCAPNARPLRAN